MQTTCKATKQDGSPCSGRPWNGGAYCWFHDPGEAERRAEGRRLGGSARSNRNRARKLAIDGALSAEEAGALLGKVLSDVINEKLPAPVGNAAANIAKTIASIAETTEIERRLAALESVYGIDTSRRRA